MSIILESSDGHDLQVNAWNWGVLHYLVKRAGLFSEDDWDPKRSNGGGELDQSQVVALANLLEATVLPRLRDGERMFFDGTVTDVPDDGTFYRDEAEMWKNYSLRHDVLVSIIAFLRSTNGPVAFL
jgi:hypothetical protein